MDEINIYCDESNHLENSPIKTMILGAVYIPKNKRIEICKRMREIKSKHDLSPEFEIKWTKVSPGKKQFYLDLVDYFFDNDDLHFRAVIIDKQKLNHEVFNQTHNDFYYKMFFELLSKILEPSNKFFIYLDIKDTKGAEKVKKLHDVLCNAMYDFDRKIINTVQQIRSQEVELMQLTDLLIGAVQFANRKDVISKAKIDIVERIKERSSYSLHQSTLAKEPKFNLLFWEGEKK